MPEIDFLRIDGHGDPNTSPTYAAAIQALYSVSYTAKFAIKKAGGEQFKVSALEGLWWSRDLSAFGGGDKSDWDWRMMIPPALQRDRRYVRAVRRRGRDEEGAPCRP